MKRHKISGGSLPGIPSICPVQELQHLVGLRAKYLSVLHFSRTTMARKSERLSSGGKATSTYHKRAASTTATASAEAKRSKKATPTKSQYFDSKDDQEAGDDDVDDELSSADEETSDFDGDVGDAASSAAEDDDDDESEDEPKPRKRSTPGKETTSPAATRTKGEELWRPGVKTGQGPGAQVVIKKPKARPAGKTPYSDDTIHPNTLEFLTDLKANNDRQWLKSKCSPPPSLIAGHTRCIIRHESMHDIRQCLSHTMERQSRCITLFTIAHARLSRVRRTHALVS
ncbi:hypothetical protein LTR36_000466 [Oleoguttula mirabilis]|uniref:Uncharacterized protein n=1 Tax=Oleoguttula mirabilis TaxID=1507867 RepID=A0AAV9JZ61_9PEZI|nr:hypothetical protein LTR36_000466 [Oleoguttula mirabilis]